MKIFFLVDIVTKTIENKFGLKESHVPIISILLIKLVKIYKRK